MSSKTPSINDAPRAIIRNRQRGWPVVATGTRKFVPAKNALRNIYGFPEESQDFSDDDVFDVAGHIIDRFCDPLPIVKKDIIELAEKLCETEVA